MLIRNQQILRVSLLQKGGEAYLKTQVQQGINLQLLHLQQLQEQQELQQVQVHQGPLLEPLHLLQLQEHQHMKQVQV